MSWLRRIFIFAAVAMIASSSGCCLFSSCAGGKLGSGLAGPGCGLETYYQGGCTDAGCEGCGDGPVIPCHDGRVTGCGLGLGCIGKLLGMAHPGCNGCGETYYHGWVNDPPCCDPCDGNGNWVGAQAGGCGCGGGGCDSCGAGAGIGYEPGCGAATVVEPGCGLAAGCQSYNGNRRAGFQIPGRALYATWTGMGGLVREFHRGFFPACNRCNNFSLTASCQHCAVNGPVYESTSAPYGYSVGSVTGRPSAASMAVPQPVIAHKSHGLPHDVVEAEMRMNHGRPPHQVVSRRLHGLRR